MESIFDWSVILSIVGVLVIVTNIVVQVLKKLTWDKLPTNILAVLIAMALTLAAFFAYCEIKGVAIVWYTVVGAVVLGFFVAYAAMFGFDKLKRPLPSLTRKRPNNAREPERVTPLRLFFLCSFTGCSPGWPLRSGRPAPGGRCRFWALCTRAPASAPPPGWYSGTRQTT